MRVGLVCPYDIGRPGGVQQLTGELAEHLIATGDEVVLIGAGKTWFHGGPGVDDVTVPAGRAISVKANRSVAPLTLSPTSWRRVSQALEEVDVVHVHEPLIPLVGWTGLSTGKPTVATFHADPPMWVHRLYRLTPGLARRMRSTVISAVSPTAARAIPSDWGPVTIIPNAVDVASYDLPTGRIERRVAFLGRNEPRKGLSVLMEAWLVIRDSLPDAQLMVMGADEAEPMPGVTFLGPVSGGEKKRLLSSSRVYVAPNLGGESFGIVLVEAMASGCAVIASDLPAFVDVADGAAVHVPAGDALALADAVIEVLGDDERASRLGEAARRRASAFDWPEVVAGYRRLYRKALS